MATLMTKACQKCYSYEVCTSCLTKINISSGEDVLLCDMQHQEGEMVLGNLDLEAPNEVLQGL